MERRSTVFALGAVLLWSTVAVAFKLALRHARPVDLVCLSVVVSWLSLGVWLLFRRPTAPPRKQLIVAVALGILNPLAYYWVLFTAYSRLPAQIAQPLNYSWPLFLALLAMPINGRKPGRRDLTGIFISSAGVALVSRAGAGGMEGPDGLGILLALGSGLIWALYWLVGKRLTMDGSLRLFIGFSVALIPALIVWGIRGFPVPESAVSRLAVIWVGLFEMGLTFLLWNGAMERTAHPARLGNLVCIGPFISLIWIALVLKERLHPLTIVGLGVIVSGILVGRGMLRRRSEP